MKFSHATTLLVISRASSTVSAFQSAATNSFARPTTNAFSTRQYAVAVDLPDNAMAVPPSTDDADVEKPFDMTGIAMSGLQGKALKWKESDFPKAKDLRAVIPKDCFEVETKTSLKYLSVSVIGTTLCSLFGARMISTFNPASLINLPFWTMYSAVTGTVAMGLWVLAHECGHGAFSKNKKLQNTVGYILHSLFLVPYYSWQRSHAVHHQYTNHMELGETHVPETDDGDSLKMRNSVLARLGKKSGLRVWGSLQSFLHLVIGWPAYLMIGATGGPDRGLTNHFWPNPLTTPKQPRRELFPGNWKAKVLKSDIGVLAVGAAAGALGWFKGLPLMMALYGGPLIVVNAWLVLYTWLQHTDVDVPHFSHDDHSFVKGALHTIDRPYDKLDPFGFIDFLHHKIGTTHVAHHFDSSIPHYKAEVATEAIKKAYPKMHLYDPTPIPKALWRISKGCTGVEKRGNKWVWNNKGVEALL
mmetsp:Transcript_23393/g.51223  ORF Transcript_23393/g.51223 Transcript_23393/m.51223 type:complete len:471 (+) Transcript_23393:216-1628(+)